KDSHRINCANLKDPNSQPKQNYHLSVGHGDGAEDVN
ncbi:unnamed protein product, partial [Adineta ricciae]